MKVLVIKTSSLGDVLHTLPALTDAYQARPGISVDWVVEEAFVDIPGWHPAVNRTISLANRRWRRQPWAFIGGGGLRFFQTLRQQRYDLVLDAQGLIKSAMIAISARGRRCGLSFDSAREPYAAWAYHRTIAVQPHGHAIDRLRQLFAGALGYLVPTSEADYGIQISRLGPPPYTFGTRYVLFFHGTTWLSKHWPESYWHELIRLASGAGLTVLLPSGNATEKARAARLGSDAANVKILPPLELPALAKLLAGAAGAVAVDTGLGHLAAAVGVPCVSIYGATDPGLTGTLGHHQFHLTAKFSCAPCLHRRCSYTKESPVTPACYTTVPPGRVWSTLQETLATQ